MKHLTSLAALLPAILLAFGGHAAAEPANDTPAVGDIRDVLGRLPQDFDVAVACSSVGILLDRLEELVRTPFVDSMLEGQRMESLADLYAYIGDELGLHGITSRDELLAAIPIDPTRPVAVAMRGENRQLFAAIPYENLEALLEAATLSDSTPVEFDIDTELARAGEGTMNNRPCAWFAHEDYLCLAPDVDSLRLMASWATQPQPVVYGSESLPGAGGPELAFLVRVNQLLSGWPEALPIAAPMAAYFDQAALVIPLDVPLAQYAAVRLLKKTPSTEPAAEPLSVTRLVPPEALGLVALRLSPAFKEVLLTTAKNAPVAWMSTQVEGFINLVTGTLGDEVAVATMNADEENPRALLLCQGGSPGMLTTLLTMTGATVLENGAHAGATLYSVRWAGDIALRYAVRDTLIVAGREQADINAALDRASEEEVIGLLPPGPFSEANQAVVFLQEKAFEESRALLGEVSKEPYFPENLDLEALEESMTGNQGYTVTDHGPYLEVAFHGFTGFAIPAAILLPMVSQNREAALRASSNLNLKQLSIICRMYTLESPDGLFPPLSSTPGRLIMAAEAVYPDYLTDLSALQSPGNDLPADIAARAEDTPEALIDDYHYIYINHLVRTEEEALAFVEGYLATVAEGGDVNTDYVLADRTMFRLHANLAETIAPGSGPVERERMERTAILAVERPELRQEEGGNVLYMNGDVAFIPWGTFPYTDAVWDAIARIDSLP